MHELTALRQALEDVANPMGKWQRELEPGHRLNGAACVHALADPETYRRIARDALLLVRNEDAADPDKRD